MQCYTELLPPSGVTHALCLPFLSASSHNLVVAKSSLLQIFNLINVTYEPHHNQTDDKARLHTTRLVLAAEYDLPGIVTGFGRVRTVESKSGGEVLIVAIRNAKLSLLEWDPEQHRISTISIHYYEKENVNPSPWAPDLGSCPSYLTVDPNGRCAVLNFGLRNLAILPFHQSGDDLVMDDYDPDIDGERPPEPDNAVQGPKRSDISMYQTPYASSFVLPLTALEPSMVHPISLTFLHEYREPTFGVLYSQIATSSSLFHERKDVVCYSVFTLDLEQRASTTILSVSRLPSDLFKIVALPPPVGGALLIGTNELVHIDQAGKTNAVGINEFARQISSFSMADQSNYELRLEDCTVEHLGADNGDMALVLSDGRLAILSFKLDGRTVSGISLRLVPEKFGGSLLRSGASCSVSIGRGKIFFGSEENDAILLGWSRAASTTNKQHSTNGVADEDFTTLSEDDEDDTYEDDLYSTSVSAPLDNHGSITTNGANTTEYIFRVHDRLWNFGPMSDVTLGKPSGKCDKDKNHVISSVTSDLELVTTHGLGRASGLGIFKRGLDPYVIDSLKIENTVGAWSVHIKNTGADPQVSDRFSNSHDDYDQYLLLSKFKGHDNEESVVYTMGSKGLEETKASEFNPNEDFTIDIGTLANHSRVIQVLRSEIRSYDTSMCNLYSVFRTQSFIWQFVLTSLRPCFGSDISRMG